VSEVVVQNERHQADTGGVVGRILEQRHRRVVRCEVVGGRVSKRWPAFFTSISMAEPDTQGTARARAQQLWLELGRGLVVAVSSDRRLGRWVGG
jgi:hypothetical protein